ncbi:MAG: hypothetical protein RMK65_04450 [Anaerolineae bacterium]|nr:hypothetical protein [Anaerolineae bacterium]
MHTEVLDLPLLIRLLEENPEWRALLRRVLLTEDLLELPELVLRLGEKVDALAEAQQRNEEALRDLFILHREVEDSLRALAESHRQTDEAVRALVEAQRQTDAAIQALAEAQRRTEAQVEELARTQRQTEERMGTLEAALQALD